MIRSMAAAGKIAITCRVIAVLTSPVEYGLVIHRRRLAMNAKLLILWFVFIDFLAFSCYVIWQEGYFGFLSMAVGGLWNMQVFLDLVIALLMVCTWMLLDARQRGANAWPYVIATFFLGSIAPLWYLIRRESAKKLTAGTA